jgi:3-hydroxyacyl-CoA dehydrogenase/enoyl-CoA hydratase/3-hydroxybutyryl-CoA epimerase
MELALACTHRVATNDKGTFFGLPETQLGILPGFGGTQRLPGLVGLAEALAMITGGGRVYAEKARRIGLVDEVVEREQLLEAARRLLAEGHGTARRAKQPLAARLTTFLVESNRYGRRLILEKARKEVRQRVGNHYPAPLAAIDAMEEGILHGREKGLSREASLLGELVVTPVCKNLVGVFRLREQFSRGDTAPARDIRRMGVIGAGVMGGGIAALAAGKGVRVRIIDLSPTALGGALGTVAKAVKKVRRKGSAGRAEAPWIASRISYDTEMRGLAGLDFVVEAVAERMDVKKKVLSSVTAALPEHAVTVSNTSSLSIGEMSGAVRSPALFCGMHFFNPVDRMPLVEVVRGEGTSDETVGKTAAYARRLGKVPVVVRDRPGFLVNRLLLPYLNEGARLLEEGVRLEAIDGALEAFGMPMGPFALLDMVGIDIASHAAENLRQGLGERFHPSAIMAAMRDAERLGRKKGRGFYLYNARGEKRRDPDLERFLSPHVRDASEPAVDHIVDRLLLAMVNEASLCLEEEVVETAAAVDVAMILGAGFPPFTGGLLRYADSRGAAEIVKVLEGLTETAGVFFKPSGLLLRLSGSGQGFYGE